MSRATKSGPPQQRAAQDGIKHLIIDRSLAPGDPLPTEFELVEELGVSRGSLREAVRSLQEQEIVDVRHGHGMFVGTLSLKSLVDGLTFHGQLSDRQEMDTAADVIDVRDILECSLIKGLRGRPRPNISSGSKAWLLRWNRPPWRDNRIH